MQTFEQALKAQIEQRGGFRKIKARRIERVLSMPKSARRQRRLEAMESRAIKAIVDEGYSIDRLTSENGAIDWSAVDWDALFSFIIKLVEMLLAAFT